MYGLGEDGILTRLRSFISILCFISKLQDGTVIIELENCMKKILLVTLQGTNNGNRLQNYALQKVLEKMDCLVYTPYYDYPERNTLYRKLKFFMKVIAYYVFRIRKYKSAYSHIIKEKRYRDFNKEYIHNMFKVRFGKMDSKNWDGYDYAVTGSDQVWHKWSDDEMELNYFYLQFMPKEKRVAYAPSFGFSSFPAKDIEIHRNGLNGFNKLCCREMDASNLINLLVGKKALVVVDPTLLLDQNEWREIEKTPLYYHNNKYILAYFLGDLTEEYKKAIDDYSIKNGFEVINILDVKNTTLYATRPDEFLWLIDHSEYVFTDSYHATIFSLLFNKRFMIFRRKQRGREDMFGRLETLINEYGLIEHVFSGMVVDDYDLNTKVFLQIKEKKKQSLDYLYECVY